MCCFIGAIFTVDNYKMTLVLKNGKLKDFFLLIKTKKVGGWVFYLTTGQTVLYLSVILM